MPWGRPVAKDLPPLVWAGFTAPQYTQVPDALFDVLLPYLSEAELRVLLYLIRRTFGFKKAGDAVSLGQIVEGITRADGTRQDWGAGVSKHGALLGLKGLTEKGIIAAERRQSVDRGHEPTFYTVLMQADAPLSPGGSREVPTGIKPRLLREPALVSARHPQETIVQETINKTDRDRTSTVANQRPVRRAQIRGAEVRFGWPHVQDLEDQVVLAALALDARAFAALLDSVGRSGGTLDEVMAALAGEER
jgi:hypothetical protein